jgi:hypothetical protein
MIESVSERQRDEETRKIGPSKQAAYDEKGNPTKAAIGFAKGQSVPVESLTLVQTDKGEYVCAVKKESGKPTAEILCSILPKWILSIPFQKSMRWADVLIRFARPIHWILAIYGGEVIPIIMGNIASGDRSYGHRFMSPSGFTVKDFQSYLQKTREAFVIVDPVENLPEDLHRLFFVPSVSLAREQGFPGRIGSDISHSVDGSIGDSVLWCQGPMSQCPIVCRRSSGRQTRTSCFMRPRISMSP